MAAKCQKTRAAMSLSSEEKKNDESDTGNENDPDSANDEYSLQLREVIGRKLQAASKVVYRLMKV